MAQSTWPTTKMASSDNKAVLRRRRLVAIVSIGPPNATPRAYPVTSRPVAGILTPRALEISGSSPCTANSVVPIANAASANVSMGRYGTTTSSPSRPCFENHVERRLGRLADLPKPPWVIADESLAKPACAPSAAPTG